LKDGEYRFSIRITPDQNGSRAINNCEELGEFLKQYRIHSDFIHHIRVAMQTSEGRIHWVAPASHDDHFLLWDATEHSMVELWNILQQYLHIRVVEFKEKTYNPPDVKLGYQEHNGLFCSF